jgi:superfamily II RNA helicase
MSKYQNKINEIRERFLAGIGVPEKQPFVPDDFQLEAIESLKQGKDTLVVAPTGAGKTYIALEAIQEVVAQGKRVVYTVPLKALSNAKYAEMKRLFQGKFTVGILTGDRKIDGDSDVIVATTEIYRNELYRYCENYGLVVLDELHYLADPQRGSVWEESIILAPRSATLLMLSASISNYTEVAEWINSIRNKEVKVVHVTKRPVELRLGFLHPRLGLLPLTNDKGEPLAEVQSFYSQSGETMRGLGGRFGRGARKGFR